MSIRLRIPRKTKKLLHPFQLGHRSPGLDRRWNRWLRYIGHMEYSQEWHNSYNAWLTKRILKELQ